MYFRARRGVVEFHIFKFRFRCGADGSAVNARGFNPDEEASVEPPVAAQHGIIKYFPVFIIYHTPILDIGGDLVKPFSDMYLLLKNKY